MIDFLDRIEQMLICYCRKTWPLLIIPLSRPKLLLDTNAPLVACYSNLSSRITKEIKDTKFHSPIAARLRAKAAGERGAARKSPSQEQLAGRGRKAAVGFPRTVWPLSRRRRGLPHGDNWVTRAGGGGGGRRVAGRPELAARVRREEAAAGGGIVGLREEQEGEGPGCNNGKVLCLCYSTFANFA